ncbi:MAG: hypothetical protein IKN43_04975, partial [Selenomonadaceae bacterium]|nr:hypothetical protein [Selenomonadaceae bacterium]
RFSMQVPVTKSGQTYSRKTIDDFIEALRQKDRELEAKDRQLEAKDRELEAKDRELDAADRAIESRISSMRSSLMSEILSSKCDCTRPTRIVTIVDPPPPPPPEILCPGSSCTGSADSPCGCLLCLDGLACGGKCSEKEKEKEKPKCPGASCGGSYESPCGCDDCGGGAACGGNCSKKPEKPKCPGASCGGSFGSPCGCDDCGGGAACGGKCANGGGPTEPEHTDNNDYKEQDVWEIDEWNGYDVGTKTFTAPCDGYIKIIGLATENDYLFSGPYYMSVQNHGTTSTWSSDGDGYYEGGSHWLYLIDDKIVTGYAMSDNDPHFYAGAVTYDGTTLTKHEVEYDDGEGSSWTEEFEPTWYFNNTIYSDTGVAISSGSTFTLYQNGYSTEHGDASGTFHTHFKVVFVPKN